MQKDAAAVVGQLCAICDDALTVDSMLAVGRFCVDGPVFTWPLKLALCHGCERIVHDCGLDEVSVGFDASDSLAYADESDSPAKGTDRASNPLPPFVAAAAGDIRRVSREEMRCVSSQTIDDVLCSRFACLSCLPARFVV
jgi:hypothetical protein